MSEARFYCPDLSPGRIRLSPEESRHAQASRRLRSGDRIIVFDGLGHEADAEIAVAGRQHLEVEVTKLRERTFEYPTRLTLATAVPKPPRQPFLIEKCTELGVSAVWPLACGRSVALATDTTLVRWHRTAVEAAKQCRAAWLPDFEPSQSPPTALARTAEFDSCLIASPGPHAPTILEALESRRPSRLLVFVGPEGGWEDDELTAAERNGAVSVTLGPRILRIETACLAIAAALAVK